MTRDATGRSVATQLGRAGHRIHRAVRPLVTITDPPLGVLFEHDVEVPVRDGTILRVNVFRPDDDGIYPVLLCAHPYSKDHMPLPRRRGSGWRTPGQFRLLTQNEPFHISGWTSWEAPDPAFWVPRGYVVVNADLRGWGRSDGEGELFARQEARDVHDLVEWAGTAPWSTGRVGLTGVSYLAITQWAVAAERPPHLAAINPWEGFTDLYRDFARPGGIREVGFLRLWSTLLKRQRRSPVTIGGEVAARPIIDDWWAERNPDLERIEVPALVCASFSDHCLHSRGSFEGHRRIGSTQTYLHTHRGPKWSVYYSDEGRDAQARFFDQVLGVRDTGLDERPPVRVEVRSDARTVVAVHHTEHWPPAAVSWTALHLDAARSNGSGPAAGTLDERVPSVEAGAPVARRVEAVFVHRFAQATDVIGPMWARLFVSLQSGRDPRCFVGVRKVRDGRVVGFEGSYGFRDDLVTHGMLRVALRGTDRTSAESGPGTTEGADALPCDRSAVLPHHAFDRVDPLVRGEVTALDIELHASATRFEAGEELHLVVRGSWFFATNPLTGQFPARYERGRSARLTLHTGPEHDSVLHLPTCAPLPDDPPRPVR